MSTHLAETQLTPLMASVGNNEEALDIKQYVLCHHSVVNLHHLDVPW